jgi:hypothetical protein
MTPWPHQIRAERWLRRSGARHCQSRLRREMRPSDPVRHLAASTNASACSTAARTVDALPMRGTTTVMTPATARSSSTVESP